MLVANFFDCRWPDREGVEQSSKPDVPIKHDPQQRRHLRILNVLVAGLTELPRAVFPTDESDLLEVADSPNAGREGQNRRSNELVYAYGSGPSRVGCLIRRYLKLRQRSIAGLECFPLPYTVRTEKAG